MMEETKTIMGDQPRGRGLGDGEFWLSGKDSESEWEQRIDILR